MKIGHWNMAQRWRHFKRPASSKGMWKEFVKDQARIYEPIPSFVVPEFDELSPKEEQYYQQGPFSTDEVFLGSKGGVPQLVQPGRMEFKRGRIVPPKTTAAHEVKKLQSDFLGKFNNKLVYQKNMDDVFEVYNVIKKNKGKISTVDVLGKEAGFVLKDGQVNATRTKLALELLRTADFAPEYKNFKFLSDRYPKLDKKGFRNLDMVTDSIINYKGTLGIDREEALAQFLPDNMAMHYKRNVQLPDPDKTVFNEMYRFNDDQIKYITDQVSEATGKKFTTKDYHTAMDDARDIRKRVRIDTTLQKRLAPINDQIMQLANDEKIQTLLKGKLNNKTQNEILERAMTVLDVDAAEAARRIFMLGEAYSPDNKYRTLSGIDENADLAKKIIETQGATKNRYAFSGRVYDHYGRVIDNALGSGKGKSFIGYYQNQIRNTLDAGMRPDEIFSVTASGRRGMEPYAIFTQSLKDDVNSKIKGAKIDSMMSRTHRDLQKIFNGRKWNQLSKSEKAAAQKLVDKYDAAADDALKGLKPKARESIQIGRFDLKNPPSKAIERWGDYDKGLQKAFNKSYDTVGYSMKVPKEFLSQKEFLKLSGKQAKGVLPVSYGLSSNFAGVMDDAIKSGKFKKFKGVGNILGGEVGFAVLDYINSRTKGQSHEKAMGKAIETATFDAKGIISDELGVDEKAILKHAQEQGASEQEVTAIRDYLNYMKKFETYQTAEKMLNYAKKNLSEGEGTGDYMDIGTSWEDVTDAAQNLKLREKELGELQSTYLKNTEDMELGMNMLDKYMKTLAAEEWNKTAGHWLLDRGSRPHQGEGLIWGGIGALARDIGAIATGQMPTNFWDWAVPAQIDPFTKAEKQIRIMERPAVGTDYPEYNMAMEDMRMDLGYALPENFAEGGIVGLLKK